MVYKNLYKPIDKLVKVCYNIFRVKERTQKINRKKEKKMEIKNDFSFEDLKNECWSGAVDTLDKVEEEGKEEELMDWLQQVFEGDIPTLTEVNDYLRFEEEDVYEALGIEEEEEEEE